MLRRLARFSCRETFARLFAAAHSDQPLAIIRSGFDASRVSWSVRLFQQMDLRLNFASRRAQAVASVTGMQRTCTSAWGAGHTLYVWSAASARSTKLLIIEQ
jgi:hypothetical protein